jgi:hypothetical protein
MKSRIRLTARIAVLVVLSGTSVSASGIVPEPTVSRGAGEVAAGWIVDRADNICGLDDAKMLSKPAKIDYDAVLKATPEMKKIKDDKIEPNSPQGIQLRQAAVTRVQVAAEKVRATDGHCSVWKTIKHSDGRAVADITESVKLQL